MAELDERMRILQLIGDHKITADEGARLLGTMGDRGITGMPTLNGGAAEGRWLRIRVTDVASGRSKASVRIPIALLDAGMKIGAQFTPDVDGADMSHMLEAIRAGASGKIFDVTDETDGEHVEIFVD